MIDLRLGNCLEVMKTLSDNSVDAIVTDPPYGLSFMGKKWDYDVPGQEIWEEALRVLKPGGYLLSFAGTRTQHRMAVRIEDAGFEIRDMIAWVYGSGFPKSRNIGKDIEKINVGGIKNLKQIGTKQGIKVETGTKGFSYSKEYVAGKSMGGRQISGEIPIYEINNSWGGWGTALKPALEPITVARKPLSEKNVAENVLKWGTGGIDIDGCRVETSDKLQLLHNKTGEKDLMGNMKGKDATGRKIEFVESGLGRFPANLIHDGSDEVVRLFPMTGKSSGGRIGNKGSTLNMMGQVYEAGDPGYGDSGSASRFFYCAKASKSERQGSTHPTMKPIKLMEYLVKLVSREGATVLDPFMGSGSTGIACRNLKRNFIGIEMSEEYLKIAEARINSVHQEVML